jgi:hypothetical protein
MTVIQTKGGSAGFGGKSDGSSGGFLVLMIRSRVRIDINRGGRVRRVLRRRRRVRSRVRGVMRRRRILRRGVGILLVQVIWWVRGSRRGGVWRRIARVRIGIARVNWRVGVRVM